MNHHRFEVLKLFLIFSLFRVVTLTTLYSGWSHNILKEQRSVCRCLQEIAPVTPRGHQLKNRTWPATQASSQRSGGKLKCFAENNNKQFKITWSLAFLTCHKYNQEILFKIQIEYGVKKLNVSSLKIYPYQSNVKTEANVYHVTISISAIFNSCFIELKFLKNYISFVFQSYNKKM